MAAEKSYICPGETHAISASVHFARLAAYYPKCAQCACRAETGALVRDELPEQRPAGRVEPQTIFRTEGVRGRYLSELDRGTAARLAAAFAQVIWERQQVTRNTESERPTIIVGYDERPSSPDLVAGVVDALRRMGCGVVDAGPVSRPLMAWTVREQHASGGLHVTGTGSDPAFTGIDFFGSQGRPLSQSNDATNKVPSLREIRRRLEFPPNRPTRNAGRLHLLRDEDRYGEQLRDEFHAIRPLRVVVGISTPLIERHASRVFDRLPCRSFPVKLPTRPRDTQSADDSDILAVGEAVRDCSAHLGFVISDNGEQFALVDESGSFVPPVDVFDALRPFERNHDDDALFVVSQDHGGCSPEWGMTCGATCTEMHAAMTGQSVAIGFGPAGRLWFNTAEEHPPVCDALVTLGRLLALLSRSDAECSHVFRQHKPAYGGS